MTDEEDLSEEERWIELKVEVPNDLSWEEIRNIEDEISEAAGDILKEHGLARRSHRRIVQADYTDRRNE